MAAQADLVRAKVKEEMLGVALKRLMKERKRKKKESLLSADKSERREKDAKKAKLHHNQHAAEHRSLQPHQLQLQNHQAHNFIAGKPVLLSQKQSHHHRHHSNLQPAPRAPEPQLLQPQRGRTAPPEAPALFTFTPLKTVKIKNQDSHDKQRDKTLTLAVKKENAEANVKRVGVKKKKGGFLNRVILHFLTEFCFNYCVSDVLLFVLAASFLSLKALLSVLTMYFYSLHIHYWMHKYRRISLVQFKIT